MVTELKEVIPTLMERKNVPGFSIAVIRDARIAWAQGFGVRNVETGEPVTSKTIFEGASFSKPATAYVAMKMCETGMLELDRPLNEYLPEPFITDDPRIAEITLSMILSHSSGLSHEGPARILHQPGKRFFYSGWGFYYLKRVIEHLSKVSFAKYMQTHLLTPLNMHFSSFIWDGVSKLAYAQGHEGGKPVEKGIVSEGDAATSLHTTAMDFAKLLIALLQPDRQDPFHLRGETVAKMLSPQIVVTEDLSWSLGWGIYRGENSETFWHWGSWHSFRNFAVASREEQTGIVLMSNSENGLHLCDEIIAHITGKRHPAFPWINTLPSSPIEIPYSFYTSCCK